jgi:23S rRNA (adenine2503-C2)-methyltransferase
VIERRPSRYGVDRADLAALLGSWGEPRYRAGQVWDGLYRARRPLDALTALPASLRERLADALPPALVEVERRTGDAGRTTKWLWASGADGAAVETVLMLYRDGRATVCVSSQAGCAMACSFCATGQAGFERHLDCGEIVEQVARAQHAVDTRVSNVVFMGMGEPLANVDAVIAATARLHDDLGISARQLTVSTVGVVPAMRRLAEARLPVTLAVSLHAPDDELRDQLVPLNRRYPLAAVLEAARDYAGRQGRRVTYEYTLLDGVNDQPARAEALAELLAEGSAAPGARPSHVNLIPYNPTPGLDARPSPRPRVELFAAILRARGVNATVRRNRGTDIDAACGQLRRRVLLRSRPGSATMSP